MTETGREQAIERANALAQKMYEAGDARYFCDRSARSIRTEARTMAAVFGDAEVFGVVSRPVEGHAPGTAYAFVFFTSDGVWSLALAQSDDRDEDHKPTLYRLEGLRLTPNDQIQGITVDVYGGVYWEHDDVNPAFTVYVAGVGDVLVDERTSRDGLVEGRRPGRLLAHVRGILAARR